MGHLNVEIKARLADPERIRAILRERGAEAKGTDHQIDTYFNVPNGRLKLREGAIENYLIHYERSNQEGPKQSHVTLYECAPGASLKGILEKALGTKIVVDKRREIYFIDNVKFHLDTVEGLGFFVEIEARDPEGTIGAKTLQRQCQEYLDLFVIAAEDLVAESYSDLVMRLS